MKHISECGEEYIQRRIKQISRICLCDKNNSFHSLNSPTKKIVILPKIRTMAIPRETVEQILQAAHIEEVVGEFVTLKKKGSNLWGNCPFHNEKTPSFSVNPARNIFKCFGCGKAGDSAKFLMEHEHYTYPEALRYLAKKYNIRIEDNYIFPFSAFGSVVTTLTRTAILLGMIMQNKDVCVFIANILASFY